jgi:integrase/recombinase XerD
VKLLLAKIATPEQSTSQAFRLYVVMLLAASNGHGKPAGAAWTPAREYDPLLDKSYRDTALGPDVLAWLDWLELGGAAARTLDQYERDLSALCHLYPSRGVRDLGDLELGAAVKRWPPASRRVRKAALDSFFKWARRTGRIEKNPMELLPVIKRRPQRYIDTFTEAEIDDLVALPLIDSVLMLVLIDAGLRKGEACSLQVRRLNVDTAELVVIGGKGDKDRVVPMTARLRQGVEELLLFERLEPQAHLWYTRPGGGKVSRSRGLGAGSFDRWWRRSLAAAGVRYRNPHTTRHTFATRWLRRGGRLETLSRAMGHESIRTTFDLYGHLDTSDVAADMALMEEASAK